MAILLNRRNKKSSKKLQNRTMLKNIIKNFFSSDMDSIHRDNEPVSKFLVDANQSVNFCLARNPSDIHDPKVKNLSFIILFSRRMFQAKMNSFLRFS